MPTTALPSPLAQELAAGHVLMMQCGASALRILERAKPAGSASFDLRAGDEAVRMAGLSARLMQQHTAGVQLLRRLPPEARAASLAPARPSAVAPEAAAPAARRNFHAAPGARRGRLKNGNPAGDFLASPRCGARTRDQGCCRQPAMANGRCRLHGGLSTGPRTPEGLARCRAARLVHGYRARAHLGLRRRAAHAARRLRALTAQIRASAAGHGVHRSKPLSAVGARCARPRSSAGSSQTHGSQANDARARAARPYAERSNGILPAGHGLHRSDLVHHGDTEALRGRTAQRLPRLASSSVSLRLCGESSSGNRTASTGHGVHRSFRDHLRSSASICGSKALRARHA